MSPEAEALFHRLADLSPDQRRAALDAAAGVSPELRAEVEGLLAFDQTASKQGAIDPKWMHEIASAAAWSLTREPGTRLGPFRLIRLLGTGGMGAVYLAERADGEVEQQVAIKLLQAVSERFEQHLLSERQLLARLSHPNIARFLDGGRLPNGQPYLVMEYVDGVPLDEYCRGLAWRQKLTIFRKICDAVGYAHRNLIVHRDLKPGNILVNAQGEPKLLDFGIAKALDPDPGAAAVTRTADRMLTPAYASPEQILGAPISAAADIHGLGATLFAILAGRPPFADTTGSNRAAIETREAPKLSGIQPDLPADLDHILIKAMRPNPDDRYTSAGMLAADLDALLESRPVSARKGTLLYRGRKFCRRYWIPLSAASVAVAGLAIGFAVASRQRDQAQFRFQQVRKLANEFLRIDRKIRVVAGMTEVRKDIVKTSLEYLETLSANAPHDDPALAVELARGYEQIAAIQGVPGGPNLGDSAGAIESFRKGQRLIDETLRTSPGYLPALRADLRNAMQLSELVNASEAETQVQRGIRDLERLQTSPGLEPTDAENISSGYQRAFRYYHSLDRLPEAERYAAQSLEWARRTLKEDPSPRARGSLGRVLVTYAEVARSAGMLEKALAMVREARALLEKELKSNSGTVLANLRWIATLNREALLLSDLSGPSLDQFEPAEAAQRKAIEGFRGIIAKDAADVSAAANLATLLIWEAQQLRTHGSPRKALAEVTEAESILANRIPDSAASKPDLLAQALVEHVYVSLGIGDKAQATAKLAEARSVVTNKLQAKLPMPCDHVAVSAEAAAVELAFATGGGPTAIEPARRLISGETMTVKPSELIDHAHCVSWRLEDIGLVAAKAGEKALADEFLKRRREIWRIWSAKLPPDNAYLKIQLRKAGE